MFHQFRRFSYIKAMITYNIKNLIQRQQIEKIISICSIFRQRGACSL